MAGTLNGLREHEITRQIGIDAGHRVPFHGSKCRHLHGHRYTIEATCRGKLIAAGEQAGMVLDFGFLKDEMMAIIDAPADHAMLLWRGDELLSALRPLCGKLLELPCIPTAENLAAYWFHQLAERVRIRSEGNAYLSRIRVHETPNCFADYPLCPNPLDLTQLRVSWEGASGEDRPLTELRLPPENGNLLESAKLLLSSIDYALVMGTKHYAKSGRALTTTQEVLEALVQDGAIDFEPHALDNRVRRDWCEKHNRGSLTDIDGLCLDCESERSFRRMPKILGYDVDQ